MSIDIVPNIHLAISGIHSELFFSVNISVVFIDELLK